MTPAPPRPPPWWQTLRAEAPVYWRFGLGAATISLLLVLWWLLTRGGPTEAIISPSELPGPGDVFGAGDELQEVDVEDHIWASLKRVIKGIAYAGVVGVSLGVLAASFRGANAALSPLVIFLRSIPMGALLPLVLLFSRDAETQKAVFIFLAVVAFVFSDTFKAISSVPQRYVETAETLGASRFQIIAKVLFPLALPDITTSLRFQFGLAFGYIMLAEMNEQTQGLGSLLLTMQKRGHLERMFLLLIVIAILAFAMDFVLRFFQRGIFQYRKDL